MPRGTKQAEGRCVIGGHPLGAVAYGVLYLSERFGEAISGAYCMGHAEAYAHRLVHGGWAGFARVAPYHQLRLDGGEGAA